MKTKNKRKFIVTVEFRDIKLIDGYSPILVRQYIEEAITGWCGSFDPEGPLFYNFKKVTCKNFVKK